MSFLKYQQRVAGFNGDNRGDLQFHRAHIDGAPFRGPSLPLREEEYQEFTEEVFDFDVGVFNIRDPEEYRRLRQIFDDAANKVLQILDYDKKWVKQEEAGWTMLVYAMWARPHRELSQRAKQQLMASPIPTPYQFQ